MIRLDLISTSPDDTLDIGRIIGENLTGGQVVALMGELGTGKTCLTQGIAQGMGIAGDYYVTSPTFTLINEYPGRIPLYHMDVYRLSGPHDLEDMGYREYFYGDGIVVIEWAEKVAGILPTGTVMISLKHGNDSNTREMKISCESDISPIIEMLKERGI